LQQTLDEICQQIRNGHGGVSKSKALNIAMKAIREEYPNPFYWAPFLLVGKG